MNDSTKSQLMLCYKYTMEDQDSTASQLLKAIEICKMAIRDNNENLVDFISFLVFAGSKLLQKEPENYDIKYQTSQYFNYLLNIEETSDLKEVPFKMYVALLYYSVYFLNDSKMCRKLSNKVTERFGNNTFTTIYKEAVDYGVLKRHIDSIEYVTIRDEYYGFRKLLFNNTDFVNFNRDTFIHFDTLASLVPLYRIIVDAKN